MARKMYGMGSPESMARPGKRRIAKANKAMTERRVSTVSSRSSGRPSSGRNKASGTVSSAVSEGKRRGVGSGTRGATSGTVSSAKSNAKRSDWSKTAKSWASSGYTPSGSYPSKLGKYTPTGAGSKRKATSGTVTSAISSSNRRSMPSATVAAARSKGAKRYAGYRQTRWS